MIYLQKLYIFTLNPLYKTINKINERTKETIIYISLFIITTQCYAFPAWIVHGILFSYKEASVLCTFFLCLIILFSIKEPLKIVNWNHSLCIPWLLSGFFMLASGFHHNIGTFIWFALLVLVLFPCLIFVWNNRGDYSTLYIYIAKATIVSLILFYLLNIFLAPMNTDALIYGYMGIYGNPNTMGISSIPGVLSSLYLLITQKKYTWTYIFTFGISFAFAFLSGSRASLIAIISIIVVFIICYLRSISERNSTASKAIIIILLTLCIGLASTPIYRSILINLSPGIHSSITIYSYAENAQEEQTKPYLSPAARKATNVHSLDNLSSGRLTIWKAYLNKLDFLGHDRNNGDLYIEELNRPNAAHNTYLEISYRSGLFAGVSYAFVALYAGIYSIRFLFGRKRFDYKLSFIPMAVFAFGIMSHLEQAVFPFEKLHILMYIIALSPMFIKKTEEN